MVDPSTLRLLWAGWSRFANVVKMWYLASWRMTRRLQTVQLSLPTLPRFRWPRFLRKIPWAGIIFLGGLVGISLWFYFSVLRGLPSPNKLATRQQAVSTKIYDRNGVLLFKLYNRKENRSLITLAELPPYLVNATVAIEDREFFYHTGISLRGMLRALKRNVFDHQLQGGSTITQQLVKNALLNRERTWQRKLKEIVLAIRVEMEFDKKEILQMYFNEVGYGGTAYGVEEASQLYFDKSAREVTLAEAALLAGLPAAPTTYSPLGANPELAIERQHQVLRRMVEDGYIDSEAAEQAKAEQLVFAPQKIEITAPHFVMYVKDLLVQKYGEQLVHEGGLEVYTTLDVAIQKLAEKAIAKELSNLNRYQINNAAALVTKPETGEILAMVGSVNYFDFSHDGQVNVTTRPRQPGSAIKPVMYSVALSNGFTPATIIEDSPIVYRIPGLPAYAPQNYDDNFHGRMTLRQALARSYNVPAVKTLSHIGVSKMVEQGQKMGITTWNDPSRFGLSLTLGGGEVKMVDLATAYGTLANMGKRVALNPILYVGDYQGKVYQRFACAESPVGFPSVAQAVEVTNCDGEQVVNPMVAYQLTDILSDNEARAPAFGRYSSLNIPGYPVAVKTGTTNNLRDNWTIGYSTDQLVTVWVGNNDNSPMSYVASGLTGAAPIWQMIMSSLVKQRQPQAFAAPEQLVKVTICPVTGTLACGQCGGQTEYFLPGTEPRQACSDELLAEIRRENEEKEKKRDNQERQGVRPNFRILEGLTIRSNE